jgi:predicted lipid-binding transport protein (Tim44 family)
VATVNTSRARRADHYPSAAPAPPRPSPARRASAAPATLDRRRRERHFARRRRDLLEDLVLGVAFAVMILSVTAGLGVVALIELGTGLGVAAWAAIRRVRRWRARRQPHM